MDEKTIKTYSGSLPYIFISYAHKNSDKVIPIISSLSVDLYRLWYDAGIQIGSNWPEAVATHLLRSSVVVFFVSKDFLASQNCQREVNYAVSQHKEVICVLLDDTTLEKGMGMQLSVGTLINALDKDAEKIACEIKEIVGKEYIGDGVNGYTIVNKKKKKVNVWQIVSLLLLVNTLIGIVGMYGYYNNWFKNFGINKQYVILEDDETLQINTFKDNITMNILLKAYNGESLYLCGNTMVSRSDAIIYIDNKWVINDEIINKGFLASLDIISDKSNIAYLALVNEAIDDFSALTNLTNLVYLDISGNEISDLSFLGSLTKLKVLKIIDVETKNYAVIKQLGHLEYLYISEKQLELIKEIIDLSKVNVVVK